MSRVRLVAERGGAWRRLVLDDPPGHLLSKALVGDLVDALQQIGPRDRVKWVTIEGSGGQFCYGARIQEHLPGEMRTVLPEAHRLIRTLLHVPAPTAALVEGRCLGGGFELALACDDVIAADGAVFALPEIRLAAFPPAAAALLPARVGASRATRAVLTGDTQPAEYWRDAGLVSTLVSAGALVDAAGAWFDRHLAPCSAVALAHAAEAARLVWRPAALEALDAAEALYLDRLLRTHDAEEGVRAWIDKRPPKWQDR